MFKPNLAGKADDSAIQFPVLASPKIDGVRAMVHDLSGVRRPQVMSRSMKPIPNALVQAALGLEELLYLDGELTVGSPTDPNCMQNTTSGVMSASKTPAFTFHVFDRFPDSDWGNDNPNMGFRDRYASARERVAHVQEHWASGRCIAVRERLLNGAAFGDLMQTCPIVLVEHHIIEHIDDLAQYEADRLAEGWEGVMLRSPNGVYKQGRSTTREGGLLKVKRFVDAEAVVIGFEEQMKNNNAKQVNELGRTKRSSHQANKEGKGTLGALICRTDAGVEFNIGTGMDDAMRQLIWDNRDTYEGVHVTYKSFPVGVKDAPRHPVFKAWRDFRDMS